MKYSLSALLLLCLIQICFGQVVETGLPFINTYTPKDYNANTQNWAVAQDKRGIMYFGNNKGVLEYDGASWRLIPVANQSIVRSLAVDSAGTIYVGAVGEFGYLAPDQEGKLVYRSLLNKVHLPDASFSDVWTTLVHEGAVYFQSYTRLFRYKAGQLKAWQVKNAYHRSFVVHNRFYMRESGIGLMTLRNDSLVPVPGGELFATEYVSAMLPFEDKVLIGTRSNGLFLLDPLKGTVLPFNTVVNPMLEKHLLYHGAVLPNGDFVFATINGGLVVWKMKENQVTRVTQNTGLLARTVYFLYPDRNGLLWMGLSNGIAKVNLVSPISVFDKLLGLEGGVLAIARFEGTLYVATHQGVFFIDKNSHFKQVEGLPLQCWQFEVFKDPAHHNKEHLLVASTSGLYEIKNDVATNIVEGRACAVKASRVNPQRVYVGFNSAFGSVRYHNDAWQVEGVSDLYNDEFRSIQEDTEGNIWLGSMYSGIIKLPSPAWNDFLQGKRQDLQHAFRIYSTDKGLPSPNWNNFYTASNKVFLSTQKGVYTYDTSSDRFIKDASIDAAFAGQDRWVYCLQEDSKGNLWYDSDKGKGVLIKQDNSFSVFENPFKRIIVSPENQVTAYADNNDIIWFGTSNGLFRYDNTNKVGYESAYRTLIRKVTIGKDSTIFYGSFTSEQSPDDHIVTVADLQPGAYKTILEYLYNSVAFHFSAPSYDDEESTQFSYRLKGYDKQWSAWTNETKKEYTNLPEGKYTFMVKARNFYGTESEEASFEFKILPPWYRTQLAYVGMLALFCGSIFMAARAYSKRLVKDNQRLEDIVQSRTAEIKLQKERIENQKNEVEKSYQNVTTLSQIGQSITSTLDLESIMNNLYFSITPLMDCFYLGVGTYNESTQEIEFKYAYEDGEELPPFAIQLSNDKTLITRSFLNTKEIFSNNVQEEYADYATYLAGHPYADMEQCCSIICVPLQIKDKTLGVITVMSLWKNAYQAFHLDILRNLASYTAIALDNTYAYLRLNEINEEMSSTLENLKTAQSHLVQAEKMASLGQLTAGVAHEINNPINFVSAGIDSLNINYQDLSELLNKITLVKPGEDNTALIESIYKLQKEIDLDYLLEEIPLLLNSINDGARRTTEIVKSLRNFTRLDEDNLKSANIHEGIDSTLVILRNQISDRIEVVKDFGSVPDIACYPGQLNQVFMNILANALQAIDGQGKVFIKTYAEKGFACISIKDTGKGMSPEVKKRIFEPFYTTKDVGAGTGLGLSICYGIIEKHKGKIDVESTPGKGTEFIIYLPLTLI